MKRRPTPNRGALNLAIEVLEGRQLMSGEPWGYYAKLVHQDTAAANYPTINGAGQTIVLIDSGIDYNHPALGGGFGPTKKVIAGKDFVDGDNDPFIGDSNVHATGIGGLLAADPYVYNGAYYQGIAPKAKLIVLRQNSSAQVKQALQWVLANRATYNIVAVNLTDFLGATFNPTIYATELAQVAAAGIFVGSPAGNLGPSTQVYYPAADPNDYASAAIGADGALAGFSQRDANIDAIGPGDGVTIPYYDYHNAQSIYTNAAQGTSWSTTFMTGTAVLLKQINPNFTPDQIISIIRDSGVDTFDPTTGLTFPRVDINAAITLAYQRMNGTGTNSAYKPISLPGVIQVEDYDKGGDGVGYHDTNTKNILSYYRGNGVDIEPTSDAGGGFDVGYTQAGEWMKYSVSLDSAATYDISFRVAAAAAGGSFHLEVDGINVTGAMSVPNTGNWQSFATLIKSGVSLSAGNHVLKLVMDTNNTAGNAGNFNWIKIGPAVAPTPTPYAGNPVAIPGTIQFEQFDNGGEGVSYHDADTVNTGNVFRTGGVDIQATSDTGGGYNIYAAKAGEWLGYSTNFTSAGSFTLSFRVASVAAGGKFHLEIDGVNVTGSIAVPNTGGAQTWTTVNKSGVNISAGAHFLKLVMDTNGSNGFVGTFNWMKFVNNAPLAVPAAPKSLATSASGPSVVNLAWVDNSAVETGFIIERKTGSAGVWNILATVAANSTAFTDNTVLGNTQYFYRVRAASLNGDSANSNEASIVTPQSSTPTPYNEAPFLIGHKIEAELFDNGGEGVSYHDVDATNLGGKLRTGAVDIETTTDSADPGYDVGWTKAGEWLVYHLNVDTSGTFNLETRIASSGKGGTFHFEVDGVKVTGPIQVINTGGFQTWQSITTGNVVISSGAHLLKVVFDTVGASGFTGNFNYFRLTAAAATNVPPAPSALTATGVSATQINLAWTDNANNETGFIIERSTDNVNFSQIATAGVDAKSYSDTGLTPGATYYYRVKAKNDVGPSGASNVASATTTNTVFLSDMTWISATNGWGPVELDMTNGGINDGDGNVLTLNGVTYAKGLGVNSPSEIVYSLNGKFSTFVSDVGVDDEEVHDGTVNFQVFADGVKIYDSGVMNPDSATQHLSLNVKNVNQLKLVVLDGGDGPDFDHADWAGAKVVS